MSLHLHIWMTKLLWQSVVFNNFELMFFFATETEMKQLNFKVGDKNRKNKCMKLHVGKLIDHCPFLLANGKEMETVHKIHYLGDVVAGYSKHTYNLKERIAKGMGIIYDILKILEQVTFGHNTFQVMINTLMLDGVVWLELNRKK